tara:strand:+ start:356 stop:685 length:330 start_codon:yes stop_codon:yes gene_type:complete
MTKSNLVESMEILQDSLDILNTKTPSDFSISKANSLSKKIYKLSSELFNILYQPEKCSSCKISLDYYRDGTEGEIGKEFRCNNCYWEEEKPKDWQDFMILPDYRKKLNI